MKGYPDDNLWGREKARRLYGKAGMTSADRVPAFKNAGSEMTHKYPDTAREPTCMEQDSPNCSMEIGQGGKERIEPVQK